jgi:DNA mismatch endonuclease, patch repair protein
MVGNRGRDTAPERRLRSALHARGLRFRKHTRPVKELRCLADIVFPVERIAVFVDGCFWHGCPEHSRTPTTNGTYWTEKVERNAARDRRNNEVLLGAGWLVMRYWEHDDVAAVAGEIEETVFERRSKRRRR